jgi:type 1 glutamine amidotransferase
VDGIFFLVHREAPLADQQKTELAEFIRGGKGLVAAHTGLTALDSWPEFAEIIGAKYGGHPISGPGRVINERPDFPATKHFPAVFDFDDEFYLPDGLDRTKADVLLRLDTSAAGEDDVAPGTDYPLAWAKNYGQGRVFYSSFSHSAATWDRRDVQVMYLEAIKWALGLTDGMVQPHAMRDAPAPEASGR